MDQYTKVGAGAIIIKDGKALMTRRKNKSGLGVGMYGTIGGHVDYNETPAQATIREAKEELGIDIGNLKFLCASSVDHGGKHYIDITFTADIISGEPTNMEPDNIESFGWYFLDALPQPLFEPVAAAFASLKTGNPYNEFH